MATKHALKRWREAKLKCGSLNAKLSLWTRECKDAIKKACGQDIPAPVIETCGVRFEMMSGGITAEYRDSTVWMDRNFESHWHCRLADLEHILCAAETITYTQLFRAAIQALEERS